MSKTKEARLKADEIRQQLIMRLKPYLNGAHHIDITIRYEGKDVHLEFDWVKELLE